MALATTTLSSACTADANQIALTSAASVAAGRFIIVDEEVMKVASSYVSGTTVPVRRGANGSKAAAHATSANAVHGEGSDFAGSSVGAQGSGRALTYEVKSYSAAGAISFSGARLSVAIINGTAALAMTVAEPTKDQDGCLLAIVANGTAAHTVDFASGLGGEGDGYDILTANSGGPVAHLFVACNGYWLIFSQAAITGTVTNLVSGVA